MSTPILYIHDMHSKLFIQQPTYLPMYIYNRGKYGYIRIYEILFTCIQTNTQPLFWVYYMQLFKIKYIILCCALYRHYTCITPIDMYIQHVYLMGSTCIIVRKYCDTIMVNNLCYSSLQWCMSWQQRYKSSSYTDTLFTFLIPLHLVLHG